MTTSCYKCKGELSIFENKISRKDECPHCLTSIKCCKMCKFYDTSSYNECRESNAERIVDKEKANFCDYFILNPQSLNQDSEEDDLLNKANSLFKD